MHQTLAINRELGHAIAAMTDTTPTRWSRMKAHLSVMADLAQVAPIIWGLGGLSCIAMTIVARLWDNLPLSYSLCAGLVTLSCVVWVLNMRVGVLNRQTNPTKATDGPVSLTADECRLAAAKDEIARLARRVGFRPTGRNITIVTNDGSLNLTGTDWIVETKQSLRALVRPDIFEEYESVLRSKDPEGGAKVFLPSLAKTLSVMHLRN
jgi:hypothetical protein